MSGRNRIHLSVLLSAIVLLGLLVSQAVAQDAPGVPPSIISFTSSLTAISVEDAEAGQTTTTLSWRTAGMRPDDRLVLQTYGQRQWNTLSGTEGIALAPSGIYVDRVLNTCGFCGPTYRLSLVDARSRVIDAWVLTIPWEATGQAAPSIASFTTGVERVDANSLAQHTARIIVRWDVENRAPGSHLVFDQVLDNGTTTSIELPRADLWVASSGQGEVAPVLPLTENYVRIRLRLIDTQSGSVYDEKTLDVPLIGSVTAPVVPTPIPQPPAIVGTGEVLSDGQIPIDTPPQIVSLIASPTEIERGGQVSVSWSVANARSVLVARLNPIAEFADFYLNPGLNGVWSLTLPGYYTDSVDFYVVAIGTNDQQVTETVTVNIRCPYTYFFGGDPNSGCPASGELQVDAIYQTFEHGFMVWRGDTQQIYVFRDDGSFGIYADTFGDGETLGLQTAPPEGLYAPARGFGKVWLNNVDVMSGIGWGTSPELPFAMRLQQSGAYRDARLYFALPDARVLYMVNGTWAFLNG